MTKIIQTTLVRYRYDVSTQNEKEEYNALCKNLTVAGNSLFNVIASPKPGNECPAGIVELECKNIFSNQWNTVSGHRIFDWYEGIYPNRSIKSGHYLVITPEMVAIRDTTYSCDYCGYQTLEPSSFCPKCLGSEYLTPEQLHLTRMQAVSAGKTRAKLTKEEHDHLLPLYIQAQLHGTGERSIAYKANQRAALLVQYQQASAKTLAEYNGFNWLLDNGITIDNCIYYTHTNTFCFGWKNPLSAQVKDELQLLLTTFPFKAELK